MVPGRCERAGSRCAGLLFLRVSKTASLKAAREKDGGSCRFAIARLRKRLVAKLVEFGLKREVLLRSF